MSNEFKVGDKVRISQIFWDRCVRGAGPPKFGTLSFEGHPLGIRAGLDKAIGNIVDIDTAHDCIKVLFPDAGERADGPWNFTPDELLMYLSPEEEALAAAAEEAYYREVLDA